MRSIFAVLILCLLVFLMAVPAMAAGFLDEMFLTSEWWGQEDQLGDLEIYTIGTYGVSSLGNSYNFLCHQVIGQQNVVAINGSFGGDMKTLFNATAKFGNPNFYLGTGGIIFANEGGFIFLPRINLGGKFGPEYFKIVLDIDFYTLVLVHAGKLEVGLELTPFQNLQLYGGMLRLFAANVIEANVLPTNTYQFKAKFDIEPFFIGGELYCIDDSKPLMIGEVGVNFSSLSLVGRVCSPAQDLGDAGFYTLGLRINY